MIRTVAVYKSLVQFVLQLLEKLTKKRVWTYPKLWDGFVKCIEVSNIYIYITRLRIYIIFDIYTLCTYDDNCIICSTENTTRVR